VCYVLRMRTRCLLGFFILTWILLIGYPRAISAEVVDRIMAIVSDEIIALSDVKTYQTFFGNGRDTEANLEELIDQKLFLSEAQKFKLEDPPAETMEEAYRQLEAHMGGREPLVEKLKQFAMSEDDLLVQIQERLVVAQFIDQRINFFVFVSPNEVKEYYRKHADEFQDLSFDQAQSEIQDVLNRKKAELRRKEYLDRLKARATIQLN